MTRDQIIDLVKKIYFGSKKNSAITPIRVKLRAALPHSGISDLIYWNKIELTPDQVVDEAIRREAEYLEKIANGHAPYDPVHLPFDPSA